MARSSEDKAESKAIQVNKRSARQAPGSKSRGRQGTFGKEIWLEWRYYLHRITNGLEKRLLIKILQQE